MKNFEKIYFYIYTSFTMHWLARTGPNLAFNIWPQSPKLFCVMIVKKKKISLKHSTLRHMVRFNLQILPPCPRILALGSHCYRTTEPTSCRSWFPSTAWRRGWDSGKGCRPKEKRKAAAFPVTRGMARCTKQRSQTMACSGPSFRSRTSISM